MNKKIKKNIYLMMLSSLLLTGCSKENKKIENNNIYIINNFDDEYKEDNHIEKDDHISENDSKTDINADLTNSNNDISNENIDESLSKVESPSIYESILPDEEFKDEEQIIEYFDKLKCDIELLLTVDNEDVADKIESRVILFIDYMVEDIKIGGYYFKDLSLENQMRIKNIYIGIDKMLEETKPDYKNMLISKSYKFKDFCIDKYHNIKDQVETWYQDSNIKNSIDNYIEDGIELYEKYKQKNKKRL